MYITIKNWGPLGPITYHHDNESRDSASPCNYCQWHKPTTWYDPSYRLSNRREFCSSCIQYISSSSCAQLTSSSPQSHKCKVPFRQFSKIPFSKPSTSLSTTVRDLAEWSHVLPQLDQSTLQLCLSVEVSRPALTTQPVMTDLTRLVFFFLPSGGREIDGTWTLSP